MKKLYLIIFLSNCIFSFYAQSKKQKIEILNNRVDSLNQVLILERSNNNQRLSDINAKISSLEKKITTLNSNLSILENEKRKEINSLQAQIKIKTDSLAFLIATYAQQTSVLIENDLMRDSLKGKVKEIITKTNYEMSEIHMEYGSRVILESFISNKRQYEANGKMTEKAYYDKNGKLSSKTKYQYDENGKMTEDAEYDANKKLIRETKLQYDALNNWTGIIEKTKNDLDYEGYIDQKEIKYVEYIDQREIKYYE